MGDYNTILQDFVTRKTGKGYQMMKRFNVLTLYHVTDRLTEFCVACSAVKIHYTSSEESQIQIITAASIE